MMLSSQETEVATNAATTAAALTLVSAAGTAQISPILGVGTQKDTTWTKLFVGGLPYHTTDKSLRDHFSVFGDIEEAVVITDRQTNKSRGYGFVIMGDRTSAERACKDPNPIIDGRKANVNLAILGAKPRTNITPASFPFAAAAGLRAGYPVIPNQFGIPSPYIYGSPYLGAAAANSTAGLVPIQATQLTQAAALAAATNFYEYQNAVAAASPYPTQYAASFETYPYSSSAAANAAAANYLAPYAAYALPQTSTTGANAGAFSLATPYQPPTNASLQEARLQ